MLSKITRIALAALSFIWAIWQFIEGNIGNGILILLLSGIFVLSYFRNERILIAFWFIRKNNFDRAQKVLKGLKDPEKSLTKGQLAYFYFLNGLMESQTNMGRSETFMRKALNTGLRMKHDQAMAKLNLAGIAIAKRRKREAMILMTEVKRLDERGLLTEQTKMLKQQMKRI
jgi:hypothetical protein